MIKESEIDTVFRDPLNFAKQNRHTDPTDCYIRVHQYFLFMHFNKLICAPCSHSYVLSLQV